MTGGIGQFKACRADTSSACVRLMHCDGLSEPHDHRGARSEASATFLTAILGLPSPVRLGHFVAVRVGETSLDYMKTEKEIAQQHYAFLVSEAESTRSSVASATDPNGHLLEVLTRPYGSGGTTAAKPHPLLVPTVERDL